MGDLRVRIEGKRADLVVRSLVGAIRELTGKPPWYVRQEPFAPHADNGSLHGDVGAFFVSLASFMFDRNGSPEALDMFRGFHHMACQMLDREQARVCYEINGVLMDVRSVSDEDLMALFWEGDYE